MFGDIVVIDVIGMLCSVIVGFSGHLLTFFFFFFFFFFLTNKISVESFKIVP